VLSRGMKLYQEQQWFGHQSNLTDNIWHQHFQQI